MFDHPRINALDLRKPGKRFIGEVRKATASLNLFNVAYRRRQEWVEWDEISWPWNLTTLDDFRRRAIRRHGFFIESVGGGSR